MQNMTEMSEQIKASLLGQTGDNDIHPYRTERYDKAGQKSAGF